MQEAADDLRGRGRWPARWAAAVAVSATGAGVGRLACGVGPGPGGFMDASGCFAAADVAFGQGEG